MLFNRIPRIEHRSAELAQGQEHLRPSWIAVLRWLQANNVEYVLVGAVAEAMRGDTRADGPVALAPAPYHRNLERLARAVMSEHARLRVDAGGATSGAEASPLKLDSGKLACSTRWTLRCGAYDIDVEGGAGAPGSKGMPSYQELLYEATAFEPVAGLKVEVASPEHIEHFAQLRRTGTPPEIKIIRRETPEKAGVAAGQEEAERH